MKSKSRAFGPVYVGLDVSLKETSICVLDDEGRTVWEGSVASEPTVIFGAIDAVAAYPERVALETGPTASWLWRELTSLGLPAICLDARHAHRILSMRHHKTDRNDARGLAELVRMGWYREAQVRSPEAQFIRSLLHVRSQLIKTRRSLQNQMRSIVKVFGVVTSSTKGRGFSQRMRDLALEDANLAVLLNPLLAALTEVEAQIDATTKKLLKMAREDRDVRRMMTVPGVGALTALAFRSMIDDPSRFSSSAKVGAFLGLAPRMRQSGEMASGGGIGHAPDGLLRSYLYEAAGVLLHKVQKWSPLKAWGVKLAKRIGGKKAGVAVARKLAVLLHTIWVDGTEFEWKAATAA